MARGRVGGGTDRPLPIAPHLGEWKPGGITFRMDAVVRRHGRDYTVRVLHTTPDGARAFVRFIASGNTAWVDVEELDAIERG